MRKQVTQPKIENWSLRWKIVEGKVSRRIIGMIIDHPSLFNNTEIDEEVTSWNGREVKIDFTKTRIFLGNIDKAFYSLIKENKIKIQSSDPIRSIEEQIFLK
jgi:hypothetical protein